MEWKAKRRKTYDERYPKETPWRWWFAWRPVEHCGRKFWLCWIPRRYVRWNLGVMLGHVYIAEYSYPEHSIAGNVLGPVVGRRHGPHKQKPAAANDNDGVRDEAA